MSLLETVEIQICTMVFLTLINKSTPKLIPSCILGRDGFVDKNDENNQNFLNSNFNNRDNFTFRNMVLSLA